MTSSKSFYHKKRTSQAKRSLDSFFKYDILKKLRELKMRITDAQNEHFLQIILEEAFGYTPEY
ncbi:MAG TPA: hypothetical protein VEP90_21310, partial [Methylomirabilota bacterium]|nr:hypothetical protein [Methylomirabilota bacterium]